MCRKTYKEAYRKKIEMRYKKTGYRKGSKKGSKERYLTNKLHVSEYQRN